MKNLFLIISILLFFSSCYKRCPDFNNELLTWLPYQVGDTIKLKNSEIDSTIIFPISSSEALHQKRRNVMVKCGCDDWIFVNTSSNSFHYSANIYEFDVSEDYYFTINGNELNFGTSYANIETFSNYNFNSFTYSKVKIYTNTIDENTVFYKLIAAQYIGIVAIIDVNEKIWSIHSALPSVKRMKLSTSNSCN